jgi:hypothetical protein
MFDTASSSSVAGTRAPDPDADLIASYRSASRYTFLRARTRRDYDQVLDYLDGHHRPGGSRLHQATSSYRADGGECPSHALCQLCPAGPERSLRARDRPGLARPQSRQGRSQAEDAGRAARAASPWTDEAIATFRARATPTARLIFELGIGSVQRPGDWPKFRWSDYDGEALRITQARPGSASGCPAPSS